MGEKGKCKGAIYGKNHCGVQQSFHFKSGNFCSIENPNNVFHNEWNIWVVDGCPTLYPPPQKKIQKIKYQNTENFSLCTWSVMLYFKECCLVLETVLLHGIYLTNGK